MKKFAMLAGAALLAAPAVHAGHESTNFDAFYTTGEAQSVDVDGFGLKVSAPISPVVLLHGEYTAREIDAPGDPSVDEFRVGGGFKQGLQQGWDFLGKAEWIRVDSDVFPDALDGFGLHAGLNFHATPTLNVNASIGYLDIEDGNGHEINLGGALQLTPTLGAILEYRDQGGDFDGNEIRLGARFSFGM